MGEFYYGNIDPQARSAKSNRNYQRRNSIQYIILGHRQTDDALRCFNLPLNWEDQGQPRQAVFYYREYAYRNLNPSRGRDSLDFCSGFYQLQHQDSHRHY